MIEPPAHTRSNPPPTIQVRLKPVNGSLLAFAGCVVVAGVLLVVAGEVVLDGVVAGAFVDFDGEVPLDGDFSLGDVPVEGDVPVLGVPVLGVTGGVVVVGVGGVGSAVL
jgi:hypothetical protein